MKKKKKKQKKKKKKQKKKKKKQKKKKKKKKKKKRRRGGRRRRAYVALVSIANHLLRCTWLAKVGLRLGQSHNKRQESLNRGQVKS